MEGGRCHVTVVAVVEPVVRSSLMLLRLLRRLLPPVRQLVCGWWTVGFPNEGWPSEPPIGSDWLVPWSAPPPGVLVTSW